MMEKEYMTIGGRRYRVEVNWNALANFLKELGRDTLEGLADLATMKPSNIAALMAASINEGERLEGRECALTGEQLGEIIRPNHVGEFMSIYIRQSRAQVEEEETGKKAEVPGE